jgi:hypothetical protein
MTLDIEKLFEIKGKSEYRPYTNDLDYFIYHPDFGEFCVDYDTHVKILKIRMREDGKTIEEKMLSIDKYIREIPDKQYR